jgi:diguanylate cyclase (GGDEF)-like protein/PAS domain S-box-containing protein
MGDPEKLMHWWRDPFTGQRLRARFRWAALLMLLPLVGLAGVSAGALVVSSSASAALDTAQQISGAVSGTDEDVQHFGLVALDVVIGRGADDLTAMSTSEKEVGADFETLETQPGMTAAELQALPALTSAWNATAAHRAAIRLVATSAAITPATASTLEDQLDSDVKSLTGSVLSLEAIGDAHVAGLRLEREAAVRTAAVAVVLALGLGLVIALWLSSRLAQSVLRPLNALKHATARLASGDLRQRVSAGGTDEIAELGQAFDSLADQLDVQREVVLSRERRLEALVENVGDGILVVDADRKIVFATPSFRAYLDMESLATARLTNIVHPDDLATVEEMWDRGVAGGNGFAIDVEARLKHTDGSWHHVWARVTNRFGDPAVAGMVINVSDVSERHQYEQRLTFQALHDSLTGLANRDWFAQQLDAAASAPGHQRVNSVLYVDVDDFKRINDTLGHQAGDAFLVAVAERLVAAVRPSDSVARLGGDEYAVLLDGIDAAEAIATAERLLVSVQQPLVLGGQEIAPRVSIGIASAAGRVGSQTMLADADLAMYFAKRSGKAQWQVFAPEMRTELLERLQLGEDLRVAIEAGGITVHYQPVVALDTGMIVGAEALARWRHPTRGWIGPTVFIALAEELNLVERIDAGVLREACTQGRRWTDAGLPVMRLAVNLSGSNLARADLVASVAGILEETGFAAANLEIELTEGVVIAESDAVLATLNDLKALGLHLAIDDFGTGYSALSRLRALPFDTLKVDKVFVDELADANPGSTLAESILDMARVLRLKVVAEGVETSLQADFLRSRGCDFAQGYLFSRAVDPSAFEALLTHSGRLGVAAAAIA